MPKKRRKRKPQHRTVAARPSHPEPQDEYAGEGLIQDLRRAIRSDEPLDLLNMVSALLDVTDPRRRNPFSSEEPTATREALLESFIGLPYAETTAVLMVMRSLVSDSSISCTAGLRVNTWVA